jgi:predicted phage tail component-like protein
MAIAGLQGFAFRGQHSSDFGIILNSLKRSILPPIQEKTITIPYMAGAHYFGKQIGERTFSLTVTVQGTDADDLNNKLSDIATWLNSDQEEEIVFDKEADKSYYGFFTGSTDLSELVTIGQATLTFVCADPYAYGVEVESAEQTTSPFSLDVGGKEATYPDIFVKFTQPSSFFTIGTSEQAIYIGENNVSNVLVPVNAKVIDDPMESTTQWQTSTSVESGRVDGSFYSNGSTFQTYTYGDTSYNGWHGAAMHRTIATPLQDFNLDVYMGMYANTQGQVGKLAIYLLDVNGNHIGKLEMTDATGYEINRFYARAGAYGTGKEFVQAYSDTITKSSKRVAHVKKVKGKNVTYYTYTPEEYGTLRDFAGHMFIQRVGTTWTAGLYKVDPKTGKTIYYRSFKFYDHNSAYMDKVAGVKVHIAQFANEPFMSPAWISHVELKNYTTITDGQTQEIFDTNDEIHISSSDGSVFLNGKPYMTDLDISSEFFGLGGGTTNQLAFAPANKCTVVVNHRPRYL